MDEHGAIDNDLTINYTEPFAASRLCCDPSYGSRTAETMLLSSSALASGAQTAGR